MMTEKDFKDVAMRNIDKAQEYLSLAEGRLEDVVSVLEINYEVGNFLLDLSVDERIPEDIRQKADELFKQV